MVYKFGNVKSRILLYFRLLWPDFLWPVRTEKIYSWSPLSALRRLRNVRGCKGYAVVCLIRSIANREVTFFIGAIAINRF
jgi:hypothetical protein